MPGRAPGPASFSAYQALKRVSAEELVERIVAALLGQRMDQASARRRAVAAVDRFTKVVEGEALRRIAEKKRATQGSRTTVSPTIDNLHILSALREDHDAMRSDIPPLARRLATRRPQGPPPNPRETASPPRTE